MFSTQTGNAEEKRQPLSFEAGGNSETVDGGGGDGTLEEVAEQEREYLRRRLRDEWQRDPTEDELDEWLREHTEGH